MIPPAHLEDALAEGVGLSLAEVPGEEAQVCRPSVWPTPTDRSTNGSPWAGWWPCRHARWPSSADKRINSHKPRLCQPNATRARGRRHADCSALTVPSRVMCAHKT